MCILTKIGSEHKPSGTKYKKVQIQIQAQIQIKIQIQFSIAKVHSQCQKLWSNGLSSGTKYRYNDKYNDK